MIVSGILPLLLLVLPTESFLLRKSVATWSRSAELADVEHLERAMARAAAGDETLSYLSDQDVYNFALESKGSVKPQTGSMNGKLPHHSNHEGVWDGNFPAEEEVPSAVDRDGDFVPFYNQESGYTLWVSTKNHRLSYYSFDEKKKNAK